MRRAGKGSTHSVMYSPTSCVILVLCVKRDGNCDGALVTHITSHTCPWHPRWNRAWVPRCEGVLFLVSSEICVLVLFIKGGFFSSSRFYIILAGIVKRNIRHSKAELYILYIYDWNSNQNTLLWVSEDTNRKSMQNWGIFYVVWTVTVFSRFIQYQPCMLTLTFSSKKSYQGIESS